MDTANLDILNHHASPCFTGEKPLVARGFCAASVSGCGESPLEDCQGGAARRPAPCGPRCHDDEPTSATAAPARAVRGASSPAGTTVWLCTPGPSEPDPETPRWASGLVGEYSRPGQRVEVRATAVYPGLSGEVAVLLAASAASGRDAVAVVPTPGLAARTRTLLAAFTEPDPARQPAGPRETDRRPVVVIDRHEPSIPGSVGLLVVLAGPVRPGATPPAHVPGASEALARWVGGLASGATVVLLCPPPGNRDHGTAGSGRALVTDIATRAGLRYAQHIVLVHAPLADDALTPTSLESHPSGPFHPVHTDAFIYTAQQRLGGAGE